ncbi:Vacuolar protein sorting-associated protein vps5, partial [Teratosphaeriaceae sp. CCFEE 6253]
MGPLGPLGAESAAEEPSAPAPPVKELASRTRTRPGRPSTGASEDGAATSLPVTARAFQHTRQPQQQPQSQPVEQASKPQFSISVGDPHTISSTTTSHTAYTVITTTTSRGYNAGGPSPTPFTVTRRYRDFLWLYDRLHENAPGVIVPPPPEKQAVGRFESSFVEMRRMALQRMVNRIASHPILMHDSDLKVFLESESFNVDVKHKDRMRDPLLGASESKGFMSSIGISTGGGGKFIEHDDWFHDR